MKTLQTLLLLIIGLFGATTASADYYVRGVARCILDDGSGNYPISEAGEVYVSTSPDDEPQWTAGEYTSATISGPFSGSASVSFHFWARAKAGYTFVGWGSTKTSKTPSAGTAELEGQPWASKTTLWNAKTEAAPNELVRYAIFRKNAEEDLTGGGVAMLSTDGTTHVQGSTSNDWPVKITFAEPLAYRDYTSYSEGYGVNTSLIASITCTNRATSEKTTIMTARIGGSIDGKGADAYGLVYFPASLTAGTYDVHLPKGLFTTQSGSVTAACNIEVTIVPDSEPFSIVSTSPTQGYAWNATSNPDDEEADGVNVLFSFVFNKFIGSHSQTLTDIQLTNTTIGCNYQCSNIAISQINKKQGIVDFGGLPDGKYTLQLPAGIFFDSNGNGNEALVLNFSIKNSDYAAWALPMYTVVTPSIANNSTVSTLDKVEFTLERPLFAAPIALTDFATVSAAKITERFDEDVDPTSPEALPNIISEEIPGVTLAVVNGNLVVKFAQKIREDAKVLISISSGAVTNLEGYASMTAQQRYNAGGCTNPNIQLYVNVHPTATGIESIVVDEAAMSGDASAVDGASAADGAEAIYSLTGQRSSNLMPGVNIIRTAKGARKVVK